MEIKTPRKIRWIAPDWEQKPELGFLTSGWKYITLLSNYWEMGSGYKKTLFYLSELIYSICPHTKSTQLSPLQLWLQGKSMQHDNMDHCGWPRFFDKLSCYCYFHSFFIIHMMIDIWTKSQQNLFDVYASVSQHSLHDMENAFNTS